MPCLELPGLPSLPSLPPGVSLPIFTPPTLPNLNLCRKIQLPAFPIPAVTLPIPTELIAAVVATLQELIAGVQAYLDALPVSCPFS